MSWNLEKSDFFDKRLKRYQKKHKEEVKAVLNNLDTFYGTLSSGVKLQNIQAGFIHPEPMGIKAIDQKKSNRGNLKETRLYVYPDEIKKILHVISIGEKKRQNSDIQECKNYVRPLKERKD